MLPDRSVLLGQKLVNNIKKIKWDILSNFQTLCYLSILQVLVHVVFLTPLKDSLVVGKREKSFFFAPLATASRFQPVL